ncbi:hypothetical protein FACS189490_14110 [Clostridia bacterium]|nr:hypothetical protein FACS189490_14110 [Clostridia bacterium]
MKLYKNMDKYYPEYRFATWVIRIATNHVIDFRRKQKQDLVPLDDVSYEVAAPSEYSPEEAYLKKERDITLKKALDGLPDMYKIPIVLYHQQGLSYQEISDVTEEPLSKVKNRIFRGRKMLKDSLISMKGESYYV